MDAIGETLRRERIRRNLDLEQISAELKISPRMLEAIEAERFDRLPGGVFAKSFVRQYARLLGLEDQELAGQMDRLLEPAGVTAKPAGAELTPIALPRVEQWQSAGDSGFKWASPLPALALMVAVAIACGGVYSWWQRSRHTVSAHRNAVAQTEAPRPQPAVETPPAPAPQQNVEPSAAAASPAVQAPSPALAPPGVPAAEKPAPAAAPAKPRPRGPVHVELAATEAVWVLARADGKYLFSGTLDANQTRMVDADATVTLRLGNAGGVNVTLNGKPLGALGPKGQVRMVQLNSGGFEIAPAPKPGAPPAPPALF